MSPSPWEGSSTRQRSPRKRAFLLVLSTMFDSTAYMRRYRAEHPDYVKRHKRSQKTRAERNQAWIYEYLLQHPCVDCGEKDPLVLEFDHIGDDKSYEVTSLTSLSLKRIQEEIAK